MPHGVDPLVCLPLSVQATSDIEQLASSASITQPDANIQAEEKARLEFVRSGQSKQFYSARQLSQQTADQPDSTFVTAPQEHAARVSTCAGLR